MKKVVILASVLTIALLVGRVSAGYLGQTYAVPTAAFVDDAQTLALYHMDEPTKVQGPTATVYDDTSVTGRTAYDATALNGTMIVTGGKWGNAGQIVIGEGNGEIITDTTIFLSKTSDWTLEGWINPTSTRTLDWYFGLSGENDFVRGGTDTSEFAAGLWYEFGPKGMQLALDTWHHVALEYEASTGYGYLAVDGTIVGERLVSPVSDPRVDQNVAIHIGGWPWGTSSQMNGLVDEVRFSDTVRYVPEPATLLLLAAGAIGLYRKGR